MLLRTAVLALSFLACESPVAPLGPDARGDPNVLHFERLSDGQRLIVDFHSQGCFSSSDAHLVFEKSSGQLQVSGSLDVSGLRNASPTELVSRSLTAIELLQLDNMLDHYRREENQTYCISTGKHTTTLLLVNPDGSTRVEHYNTDSCIEYRLVKDGEFTEMHPRENMLFFNDLTRPALEQMLTRTRHGAA